MINYVFCIALLGFAVSACDAELCQQRTPLVDLALDGDTLDRGPLHLTTLGSFDQQQFAVGANNRALVFRGDGRSVQVALNDGRIDLPGGATLQLWFRHERADQTEGEQQFVQNLVHLTNLSLNLTAKPSPHFPGQNEWFLTANVGRPPDHLKRLICERTPILAGQWTHAALTYDASARTASVYLNGALCETASLTVSPVPDRFEVPMTIGTGHKRNNAFTGAIDDVQLIAASISEDEYRRCPPACIHCISADYP